MESPQPIADSPAASTVRDRDIRWRDDIFQGDVSQWTWRVVLSGFVLGGMLSVVNLYLGAKTGATVGVAITSTVLASAWFSLCSRLFHTRPLHILENVQLQSISSAAGYTASPLTASLVAFMLVSDTALSRWGTFLWLTAIAAVGAFAAIPLKRLLINDRQLPFPEGRACAMVLSAADRGSGPPAADDSGVSSLGNTGHEASRVLLGSAALAAGLGCLQSGWLLDRVGIGFLRIPEHLDAWYYRWAGQRGWWVPSFWGTPLPELTMRATLDAALFGLGGMMGMRIGGSLLAGAILNYCVLAPWMISCGEIPVRLDELGQRLVGFRAISSWSLWTGTAMMTAASMVSLAFILRTGWRNPFSHAGSHAEDDPLSGIELPMTWMWIGLPIVSAWAVFLAHALFGIAYAASLLAIGLSLVGVWIAAQVTGITSITPTGAVGKLSQLGISVVAPGQISTNVAAAGLTAEASLQAATLIQNMKPGYMLGAHPRWQFCGHLWGAFSGAVFSATAFHGIFVRGNPSALVTPQFPFPAAQMWKAVGEMLTVGVTALPRSALACALVGGVLAILLEVGCFRFRQGFPLSAMAMGLAFVIPFNICLAVFGGALMFWWAERRVAARATASCSAWLVARRESICGGLIAGAALMGMALAAGEAAFP